MSFLSILLIYSGIGIVQDSYSIPAGSYPNGSPRLRIFQYLINLINLILFYFSYRKGAPCNISWAVC